MSSLRFLSLSLALKNVFIFGVCILSSLFRSFLFLGCLGLLDGVGGFKDNIFFFGLSISKFSSCSELVLFELKSSCNLAVCQNFRDIWRVGC